MSVVISFRVPKEIKEEMDKIKINWSDYLREMIKKKIKEVKRLEAARKIDEIRKKTKKGVFDAAKSVRKDRDTL